MQLPLYHRPNALVFLDDDAHYLEMLAIVMPPHWCVRLYTHVDDCLGYLRQEHALWEADVGAHHQMVERWRAGSPLVPQILAYWRTHSQRFALTNVCVVDYAMPAMTGLDFLKLLPSWPANRVLLTGKADEQIAISAFNQGLIGQFVPKQRPDIGPYLLDVLARQRATALDFHQGIWRNALKKEQAAAMQYAGVAQVLQNLLHNKKWVEYAVVPEPFGILGLDAQGFAHWLALEQSQELPSAADLAESTGQNHKAVQSIRAGTHLANTELLLALGMDTAPTMAPTFPVDSGGQLLGAFFALPEHEKLGPSYQDFLDALPTRSITEL